MSSEYQESTPSSERSPQEYGEKANQIVQEAARQAQVVEAVTGEKEVGDVLQFLKQNSCLAAPRAKDKIDILTPNRAHLPLKIVPCFSDDIVPIIGQSNAEKKGTTEIAFGGFYAKKSGVIVLTNVDEHPNFDNAFTLLHEARHARRDLDKHAPKETDEQDEANSWLMGIKILNSTGGTAWQEAVESEKAKIAPLLKQKNNPDAFIATLNDYPDLNSVLGETNNKRTRQQRSLLVAAAANIELSQLEGYSQAEAARRKITSLYKWAKGKK